MTGGSTAYGEIKKTLIGFQQQIDNLETELKNKEREIANDTHLRRGAESEVAAMTRRIRLLEEDLEVSSARLTETTAKLEEASKTAEESERTWREINNRLNTYDQSVEKMEKTVNDATNTACEADRKFKEVSDALATTDENLRRVKAQCAQKEKSIENMERALKELTTKLKHFEIKNEQSLELEQNLEAQYAMLQKHVMEAETRALNAEKEVERRVNDVKRAKERISTQQRSHDTLRHEVENVISEFQSI